LGNRIVAAMSRERRGSYELGQVDPKLFEVVDVVAAKGVAPRELCAELRRIIEALGGAIREEDGLCIVELPLIEKRGRKLVVDLPSYALLPILLESLENLV